MAHSCVEVALSDRVTKSTPSRTNPHEAEEKKQKAKETEKEGTKVTGGKTQKHRPKETKRQRPTLWRGSSVVSTSTQEDRSVS
jgi:hypothetical protein